jgi:glycosyltransferase involved in cell wall biosynthesis
VAEPRLLVLSTLFPSPAQPNAGLFIRERMFRVGEQLPLTVLSPQPWFPLQGLVRAWRPHFRPSAPRRELQAGFEVLRPRFLCVPGALKRWDGLLMALGALPTALRLRRGRGFDVIDAHFAYPEGYAATLLGRWLGVPVTITLRGTEVPLARDPGRRRRILLALRRASRVFAVADALKRHVVALGADPEAIEVVGNAVDTERFRPVPRAEARAALGLPAGAPTLISVGGLVERKGFHRVIEVLPGLRRRFPDLSYLVVGGPGPEGDYSSTLKAQVARLGLEGCVHFLGHVAPDRLSLPLSAADVFVLATANEGWANVFLEAMACGLPVVTTEVGGNREVVCRPDLGTVVPFGDGEALEGALAEALARTWNRQTIIAHAHANSWSQRTETLVAALRLVAAGVAAGSGGPGARPEHGPAARPQAQR